MWLRIADNRYRDLELYRIYADSAGTASGERGIRFRLLAAEKRLDLYGPDAEVIDELEAVVRSEHILFSPMAMVILAENGCVDPDSIRSIYSGIIQDIPESDLAGKLEEYLGVPPSSSAASRPSAVLERSWALMEELRWEDAWDILDDLLDSPFSYEVRAEALWAAYVASESARMDPGIVNDYLRELTSEYPQTPQGIEAALRRAEGLETGDDPEGGGGDEE